MSAWVISQGIKRSGGEFYYSPLSSAEVKNDWSYNVTAMSLHGEVRDSFASNFRGLRSVLFI
jgi:hypothetical protein